MVQHLRGLGDAQETARWAEGCGWPRLEDLVLGAASLEVALSQDTLHVGQGFLGVGFLGVEVCGEEAPLWQLTRWQGR